MVVKSNVQLYQNCNKKNLRIFLNSIKAIKFIVTFYNDNECIAVLNSNEEFIFSDIGF